MSEVGLAKREMAPPQARRRIDGWNQSPPETHSLELDNGLLIDGRSRSGGLSLAVRRDIRTVFDRIGHASTSLAFSPQLEAKIDIDPRAFVFDKSSKR